MGFARFTVDIWNPEPWPDEPTVPAGALSEAIVVPMSGPLGSLLSRPWSGCLAGYSGDNGGGSEVVWRVGGLMVYASVPVFVAALGGLSVLIGQPAASGPKRQVRLPSDIPARWPRRRLLLRNRKLARAG